MVVAGVTTGHEVRESRNKGEGAQVITMSGGEGCVMQETETVLSVIREPITRKVITGEPVMGKLIRRVCAVRRFVVSPVQPGGTRREVLGSPD